MISNDGYDAVRGPERPHDFDPDQAMPSHVLCLYRIQRGRFRQNRIWNSDLANVMDDAAEVEGFELARTESGGPAQCACAGCHALNMSLRAAVFGSDSLGERKHHLFGAVEVVVQVLQREKAAHAGDNFIAVERPDEKI